MSERIFAACINIIMVAVTITVVMLMARVVYGLLTGGL
jgi:hypothetical protein